MKHLNPHLQKLADQKDLLKFCDDRNIINIINKKLEIIEKYRIPTHDNYGIHIIFYQHETDNKKKNIYLFTEKG